MTENKKLLKVTFCLFAIGSWLAPVMIAAPSEGAVMNVCAEVKERLVLKVWTGGDMYEASGEHQATIIAPFRLRDDAVMVDVWMRVPRSQTVQLLVRQLPSGMDQQPSFQAQLGWEASGQGFCNGMLDATPGLMGSWSGSGHYSGSIHYHPLNMDQMKDPDRVVMVHYCLISL